MHFTLADLITDITQNACEADSKLVELEISENGKEFRFLVRDDGKGMTGEEMNKAIDPFVTDGVKHPHRKIGLGLPFLIQTANQSGGGWDAKSEKGKGTTAEAWFDIGNVDTPPVGDLPGAFRTILMFQGAQDVVIRRNKQSESEDSGDAGLDYEICKTELLEAIGDFEDISSLVLLDQYLRSLEEE